MRSQYFTKHLYYYNSRRFRFICFCFRRKFIYSSSRNCNKGDVSRREYLTSVLSKVSAIGNGKNCCRCVKKISEGGKIREIGYVKSNELFERVGDSEEQLLGDSEWNDYIK